MFKEIFPAIPPALPFEIIFALFLQYVISVSVAYPTIPPLLLDIELIFVLLVQLIIMLFSARPIMPPILVILNEPRFTVALVSTPFISQLKAFPASIPKFSTVSIALAIFPTFISIYLNIVPVACLATTAVFISGVKSEHSI